MHQKKAEEAKEAAGEAANTILGTAIHAKDVAVEKVQEIGHSVVETVQAIPAAAANAAGTAATFVGEKISAAGHWAAEMATEVGAATVQSAQDAIHSLTGLAGEAKEKVEEAAEDVKQKGTELKEQASEKVDQANEQADEVKGEVHTVTKGTAHNVSASCGDTTTTTKVEVKTTGTNKPPLV